MLEVGDKVRLFGGYDLHPTWLGDKHSVTGVVESFIPGSAETTEAVIRLDEPISAGGATGSVLVVGLLFKELAWEDKGIVKVELCGFEPEAKPRRDRRKGAKVEKGASYQKLSETGGGRTGRRRRANQQRG